MKTPVPPQTEDEIAIIYGKQVIRKVANQLGLKPRTVLIEYQEDDRIHSEIIPDWVWRHCCTLTKEAGPAKIELKSARRQAPHTTELTSKAMSLLNKLTQS